MQFLLNNFSYFLKSRFTPFLKWIPKLQSKDVIISDLLAGITGAVIVLPQ